MNIVSIGDRVIECYGDKQWDSNYEIVCEDEMDDGVYLTGVDFENRSWLEIVQTIEAEWDVEILEISAI